LEETNHFQPVAQRERGQKPDKRRFAGVWGARREPRTRLGEAGMVALKGRDEGLGPTCRENTRRDGGKGENWDLCVTNDNSNHGNKERVP